ncbi:MAG TPA: hypothetical protein VN742_04380 [Candidatus Binataceae bacterium]|nr:hypothetical protein [Candidatus Binataceae bacterium]
MEILDNIHTCNITRAIMSALFISMASLVAAGCATPQETPIERAQRIEPMLSGAGFHVLPADTPARKTQLQSLTPLEIRFSPQNGEMHYWFADPYHCICIFSGNEEAYEAYERAREKQRIANEEEMTALMNEAAEQENMTFMVSPANEIFY